MNVRKERFRLRIAFEYVRVDVLCEGEEEFEVVTPCACYEFHLLFRSQPCFVGLNLNNTTTLYANKAKSVASEDSHK